MFRQLQSARPYLDWIQTIQAHPELRDPMLLSEAQLRCNLLDAQADPANRIFGTFDGETLTGLFVVLVLDDERYLELLAGLSASPAAYDELLGHLKAAYPGYHADFVFNPRNRLLRAALEALHADFEPEQLKLRLGSCQPYPPDSRVRLYSPEYRAQYLALHTTDRYWTAERVLDAPETFRVLLAMENGRVAGYLDLTADRAENEPFDLFIRPDSRRRGLARALLSAAISQNRPNAMALLVDFDNIAAIALYTSMGFVPVPEENNLTASLCL